MAGKGDKTRPYDKVKFTDNYNQINWSLSAAPVRFIQVTIPPVNVSKKCPLK